MILQMLSPDFFQGIVPILSEERVIELIQLQWMLPFFEPVHIKLPDKGCQTLELEAPFQHVILKGRIVEESFSVLFPPDRFLVLWVLSQDRSTFTMLHNFSTKFLPDAIELNSPDLKLIQKSIIRSDCPKLWLIISFQFMGSEQSAGYDSMEFKQPLVGFENKTNTICYANSILQVLYYNDTFRELILSQSTNSGVMHHMCELYSTMARAKKPRSTLSTKKLMAFVQEKNEILEQDNHQDCHEFFMWLINAVNDELVKKIKQQKQNYNQKQHPTLLEKELFSILTTRTICSNCKSVSERDELQVNLSVHLPEPNISLSHCIRNFSSVQHLKGQDKFFCDKCQSLQQAQKTTLIKSLPRYLNVHLKRFKYDERIRGLVKINWQIAFPLQLVISTNYSSEKTDSYLYRLYGIIVHIGQGNKYGHYIAVVRINDRWIQFNDDQIQIVDEHMIEKLFGNKSTSMCAYMLFYERSLA